jgi:deoxyribodipyrimidine photo-lyase
VIELAAQLAARRVALGIVRGDPTTVVVDYAKAVGASRVVATRDHSPYGVRRDANVERSLRAAGIDWHAGRGLLIHEPGSVERGDGAGFGVFSPFHRAWASRLVRDPLPIPAPMLGVERPAWASLPMSDVLGPIDPTADRGLLLEPGEAAARRRLDAWAGSDRLAAYATDRDRLDKDGTSRLSQDLRWGLVSPVEALLQSGGDAAGPTRFRTELAWRDFYAHLLARQPRLRGESFRRDLDDLWSEPAELVIDAWRAGLTGYPIVDAAMRQLRATGWMHNRGRMIVASFLTKQLGVDWRVGEAHFMAHLVDGDIASNNGGWQWAASVGTDPQPYIRVFNPVLQGRRHDPDGSYVRKWVTELADQPVGTIHDVGERAGYPPPIVDHREGRERALERYAAASAARRKRSAQR